MSSKQDSKKKATTAKIRSKSSSKHAKTNKAAKKTDTATTGKDKKQKVSKSKDTTARDKKSAQSKSKPNKAAKTKHNKAYAGNLLNVRQKKFAAEYIKTGNATQSAITAGYSEKYAARQGSVLLKNENVRRYLHHYATAGNNNRIISAQKALEILSNIALGKPTTKVVAKEGEIPIYPTVKNQITAIQELLKRDPMAMTKLEQAELKKSEAEAALAQAKERETEQIYRTKDKQLENVSTEDLEALAAYAASVQAEQEGSDS